MSKCCWAENPRLFPFPLPPLAAMPAAPPVAAEDFPGLGLRAMCLTGPPTWHGTPPATFLWPTVSAMPGSLNSIARACSSSPGAQEEPSRVCSARFVRLRSMRTAMFTSPTAEISESRSSTTTGPSRRSTPTLELRPPFASRPARTNSCTAPIQIRPKISTSPARSTR